MRPSCTRRRPATTACTIEHKTEGFDAVFDAAPVKVSLTIDNQRLTAGADRAARRGGRLDLLERRADVLHLDAGAALRAHVRGRDLRHPRGQGARRRARRRRRLRLEDRRLRRGVRARAGLAPHRPAGQVDRDALRVHGLDRRTAATSCRRPRSRPTSTAACSPCACICCRTAAPTSRCSRRASRT